MPEKEKADPRENQLRAPCPDNAGDHVRGYDQSCGGGIERKPAPPRNPSWQEWLLVDATD